MRPSIPNDPSTFTLYCKVNFFGFKMRGPASRRPELGGSSAGRARVNADSSTTIDAFWTHTTRLFIVDCVSARSDAIAQRVSEIYRASAGAGDGSFAPVTIAKRRADSLLRVRGSFTISINEPMSRCDAIGCRNGNSG